MSWRSLLLDDNQERAVKLAQGLLDSFPKLFTQHWNQGINSKLGFCTTEEGDTALVKELLETMLSARLDYTATLRAISGDPFFSLPEALAAWHLRWSARISSERNGRLLDETLTQMKKINPAVIARNHLVEEALKQGVEHGDYTLMNQLVSALQNPFNVHADFSAIPVQDDEDYRTFCGT